MLLDHPNQVPQEEESGQTTYGSRLLGTLGTLHRDASQSLDCGSEEGKPNPYPTPTTPALKP